MKRQDIFKLIEKERERQNEIHPIFSPMFRTSILGEEVGEVNKAWNEGKRGDLKEELIHVAAVAVRWLELFND